ncbi:hypothetical protein [Phycicoccus avicenniae]|uniref:hypothetical protein n=1 Tax=Phycicoccus avicenniae TaxID=2828860 RepID=UPI003D29AB25
MVHHPTRPEAAQELLAAARARLTLSDEVGLALRAHRRRLRLSQRAYAALRGYSRTTLGRLEVAAGGHRLDDVVRALEGTGFALYLGRSPTPPRVDDSALSAPEPQPRVASTLPRALPPEGAPSPVGPEEWPSTELVARVRGETRRFPGHLEATRVSSPPRWWWMHEFFSGPTPEPLWYSPRPVLMPNGTTLYLLAADDEHSSDGPDDAAPLRAGKVAPDDPGLGPPFRENDAPPELSTEECGRDAA